MNQMKVEKTYNIKRVHFVNLVSVCMIAILMSVLAIYSLGMTQALSTVSKGGFTCIFALGIFFIPLNDNIKALLYCIIPSLMATISFLTNSPFLIGNHYLIFISIAMISLYFNKALILIFGGIVNIVILTLNFLALNSLFMGQYRNIGSIIALLLYINIVIFMLYFLTSWGSDLVKSAAREGNKSRYLLEELEKTMEAIQVNTMSLNEDIKDSTINLEAVKETSSGMTITVQEVAKGVVEQANNITQINEMINEASEKVTEVHNSSIRLAIVSETASKIVIEGSEKIKHMGYASGSHQQFCDRIAFNSTRTPK